MPISPAEPDPSPVPSGRRWRPWIAASAAVVAVVAAIAVGLALIDFSGEPDNPVTPTIEAPVDVPGEPDHPVAETGEALILIAPFANYTAGQLEFNIRGRLRDSINREIAAAGLEGIRIDDWVETVPGNRAALSAAEQSGAAIVIWGEYDSGRVLANLTSTPTENESLGPQVVEIATSPSELPTAINLNLTAEVRSVALLTLSQVYLQRGEYEPAKTVLYQALEHPPADPAALANTRYRLGQAYLGGEYADLDEAIWRFTEVLEVQPRSADTYGSRGLAYLERGRPGDEDLAIADLTRASELAPHLSAPYLNRAAAYAARGRLGDLDRALGDLKRAIDAGVEGPGVRFGKAIGIRHRRPGGSPCAFPEKPIRFGRRLNGRTFPSPIDSAWPRGSTGTGGTEPEQPGICGSGSTTAATGPVLANPTGRKGSAAPLLKWGPGSATAWPWPSTPR